MEKDLGGKRLNRSDQGAAVAGPTGCWAGPTRATPAEIKSSPHTTQHLSGLTWNTGVTFGPCYGNKDVERLEIVQRKITKMIKELGKCFMRKG